MNQKTKYTTGIVLSVLVICALTIPAFALTESDVQSQVSASGKEGVAGNLFVWFLCAVAFLKISQKIDSFMQALASMWVIQAALCWQKRCWPRGASLPPVASPDEVEAVMQGEPEAPVAVAVTAIPSCKAVWPVLPIAASITAHTETPPAQAAAALAAWHSVPL